MSISMFDMVFPTQSIGLLMTHEVEPRLIIFLFVLLLLCFHGFFFSVLGIFLWCA